ncbi:aspartate--tRNA ligase [Alkalispirochaeta alkalica]|uniref:aspartate--tRNA ligase n=1 Tax=Alkalispirochaeta alkalica TaxID=46356 RepID=UPI0003825F7E|nr:aspartate--tRNA ligase [Alkalispirochaeta alkalica]
MEQMKRTHTCGALGVADTGKTVRLNGWVHRTRDHGGVHFLNLRDRYGITQVVIGEEAPEALRALAASLRMEYCIALEGVVLERPQAMKNPSMVTGEIEVSATRIEILNTSEAVPFTIDERSDARDDVRLTYRYLDLRSFSMQRKIALRHTVMQTVREYLSSLDFIEIETPTMIKSTPEGARDFLIPSRLHPGQFYAMPQSPQLYKQILMASGFDRYFQIAHCFRDEDARGDRQLEHSQIDLEMSFVGKDEVFAVIEGMMTRVFHKGLGVDLETPFPRIPYDDAMNRYGSDKPDLRFDLELQDFAAFVAGSGFGVFENALAAGGAVKALVVPGQAGFSRKQITDLEETARTYGARGLAWTKVTRDDSGSITFEGGIAKFFAPRAGDIAAALGAGEGDLLLFVADQWKVAVTALGAVRSRLGHNLKLIEEGTFRFAWIVDFPLFEYDQDEDRWTAAHHLFSMPQAQYLETLESDPGSVKGDLYDLVCNGFELASGSIRIHDPALQQRVFQIVGFDPDEARRRFGFLLEAFRYGAPPHGGIAPGLDRLVMIMAGEESIREVIAFPKTATGVSPMDSCPGPVEEKQLAELGLMLAPRNTGNGPAGGDTPGKDPEGKAPDGNDREA